MSLSDRQVFHYHSTKDPDFQEKIASFPSLPRDKSFFELGDAVSYRDKCLGSGQFGTASLFVNLKDQAETVVKQIPFLEDVILPKVQQAYHHTASCEAEFNRIYSGLGMCELRPKCAYLLIGKVPLMTLSDIFFTKDALSFPSIKSFLKFYIKLLKAVQELHTHYEIAHNDLHFNNITMDTESEKIFFCDWGFAAPLSKARENLNGRPVGSTKLDLQAMSEVARQFDNQNLMDSISGCGKHYPGSLYFNPELKSLLSKMSLGTVALSEAITVCESLLEHPDENLGIRHGRDAGVFACEDNSPSVVESASRMSTEDVEPALKIHEPWSSGVEMRSLPFNEEAPAASGPRVTPPVLYKSPCSRLPSFSQGEMSEVSLVSPRPRISRGFFKTPPDTPDAPAEEVVSQHGKPLSRFSSH